MRKSLLVLGLGVVLMLGTSAWAEPCPPSCQPHTDKGTFTFPLTTIVYIDINDVVAPAGVTKDEIEAHYAYRSGNTINVDAITKYEATVKVIDVKFPSGASDPGKDSLEIKDVKGKWIEGSKDATVLKGENTACTKGDERTLEYRLNLKKFKDAACGNYVYTLLATVTAL